MSRPSTQKQILSLPFRTGLSQKQDERWLEPGAMFSAQNVVKLKTNTFQKRKGYTALASGSFTVGRALFVLLGDLVAIAKDVWMDAAWNYDDVSKLWNMVDRVPEVYALPDRTVAAYTGVIREMDTACVSGIEVHTWLVSSSAEFSTNNNTGLVFYCVIEAATGRYIVQPGPILFNGSAILASGTEQSAAKLAVVGTNVVFGAISRVPMAGPVLYMASMDALNPQFGFGGALIVDTLYAPTALYSLADMGTWDMSAPPGSTSQVLVAYQDSGQAIRFRSITCSTPTGSAAPAAPSSVGTFDMASNDAIYTADGKPYLTAIAIDAPPSGGIGAVAYSYETQPLGVGGNITLRLNAQTFTWTATNIANTDKAAINLVASQTIITFPNPARFYPRAIALCPRTAHATTEWHVAFGPSTATEARQTDFTMDFWISRSSGLGIVVAANSPRLTYGCVPASQYMAANGIAYMMVRKVSAVQGTYFLMAADWWSDSATANAPGLSYFPMRLVATYAPRLSSTIYQPLTNAVQLLYPGIVNLPYLQDTTRNGVSSTVFPTQGNYSHVLPHVVANASAQGVSIFQTLISVSANNQSQNPTVAQWDMASPLAYQSAPLGKNTGIATGCPSLTDGTRVHEFAMPYSPFIISTTVVATGGTAAGQIGQPSGVVGDVYQYIAIYDWEDSTGQLHRSGRSAAVSATGFSPSGNNTCFVDVSTMGFSAKEKCLAPVQPGNGPQSSPTVIPITIRLFRTQANGSLYYEVGAVTNDQGIPTVTFVDGSSDVQIGTNRLLYNQGLDGVAQGSILDTLTPPAFQGLRVHKNRYFGIDGNNVWGSKELVDGEGAGFNELMAFSWYDGPGFITAAESLDDKFILWKADRVGYITGEGPEDDGGQNDWSPVTTIASDTGCIDWRSVVITPKGIRFLSATGYRLLTRDLQVVPVPDVEDVLTPAARATNGPPVVTSSIQHPTEGRVVTTLQGSTTDQRESAGTWLNEDYILDSWTTFQMASAGAPPAGAVGACVANLPISAFTPGGAAVAGVEPVYCFITQGGSVYAECQDVVTGNYMDGALFVPTTIETSWIKSGGIENFQRFRRLQVVWRNMDPHQLLVYVAYDYTPTYYLMGTVTSAQMAAQQNNPLCQELFSLPRRRAEAVRFKIVDAADATTAPVTGQGALLISMGLEIATYTNSRTNRLPATQRA